MPWTAADAKKHTKKAASPAARRQWAKTANRVFGETRDEGKAIRIANAAVAKRGKRMSRRKKRKIKRGR